MKQKNSQPQANLAAIYARFSSSNQREESILAQLRACEEYAEKQGLVVVERYTDSARSALTADRPEFQRMIADSAIGKFHVVLVHKLDRFSRDKYDAVTCKRKLKANGVRLISVLENIDGSPESIMMESVLEGMAQYYSTNLAREVMKGMRESAYNCTHLGGIPPLGYDVDPVTKKYVINEPEAVIVRTIFHEYANDLRGYSQLLDYLNGMGYRTKRGKPFGSNSLNSILKNEKYIGIYVFNLRKEKDSMGRRNPQIKDDCEVIRIEGGLPAIIDRETFEVVRAKMRCNASQGGKHKAREVYLLSGLLRCGMCGDGMYGNTRFCGRGKSKYSSYRCANRLQHKGCSNKELRKEYLENFVLDELYDKLFSENSIERLTAMLTDYARKKSASVQDDLSLIQSALREVERQVDAIIQLVSVSGISADTVASQMKELEGQKRALEAQEHEINCSLKQDTISEEQVRSLIAQSRDFVKAKNLYECRQFIESYVEKVLVFDEKVEVYFKINVPDEGGEKLEPLCADENIKQIRSQYKAG